MTTTKVPLPTAALDALSDKTSPGTPAGAAENVKVIVRVRPMNEREHKLACKIAVAIGPDERGVELRNPKDAADLKAFPFYTVYGIASATERIYNECVAPLVESVLEGYNATIFAYGQTGSGKSFSMQGVGSGNALPDAYNSRGIIPRAFEHVFDAIQTSSEAKFLVHCAYIEIYMEDVRDLLSKTDYKKPLELRESPNTRAVYVQGLTWNAVKSVDECQKIMQRGWKNRSVGETLMNRDSSRSHSVFTIAVERMTTHADDGSEHIIAAKLNLVDLAGSERQSKTGATGDRLKEATKINLSLSALANVISALTDARAKHVPFRDSKLTRLLQDSLGGNTKTLMVACVSPADNNYEETLSTLRYASRAQRIKNKPIINEDPKDALLRQYQEEIMRLKTILEQHNVKPHAFKSSRASVDNAASVASVFDIEAERRRLELEKQRELDEETQRLQREFERQMVALRQAAVAQQQQLEQAQAQQQNERTQTLQNEKVVLQETIEALRRQYEDRITETAEKQTKVIDAAASGPDVIIVDAGDDQPLIGSTKAQDDTLQDAVINFVPTTTLPEASVVVQSHALLKHTAAQCEVLYVDKAIQADGGHMPSVFDDEKTATERTTTRVLADNGQEQTPQSVGKQNPGVFMEKTHAAVKTPRPATAPELAEKSLFPANSSQGLDTGQTKDSPAVADVSKILHNRELVKVPQVSQEPQNSPSTVGSSEDLRKRIAELEKQVVGGERKDDEKVIMRRERQLETADEHRRKFARIVASAGERENEEQAMFEVYENIQSDLVAQERQLKLAKRNIVNLTHELQDVRDEFGEERSNMLQMTREAERQRQLFDDALGGLGEAPSLHGGFKVPQQQQQQPTSMSSALNNNFDDRRLFERLANVQAPGLRIKRQDHLRGGGTRAATTDNIDTPLRRGSRIHDPGNDALEGLLLLPKLLNKDNENSLHGSNVKKPRNSQSSNSRSRGNSISRRQDKQTAGLISLPRPKL